MHRPIALLTLIAAAALAGCEVEERVVSDGWAGLRELADQSKPAPDSAMDSFGGWTVLVDRFDGPDARQQANRLVDLLQREKRIPDVWVSQVGNEIHVYRGRFEFPSDPYAQHALREVRNIEIAGARPYAKAEMVSLSPGSEGVASPWDLKQFPGMYSLQIAVYDEQIGGDFREAAEKAVKALRDDGEEAYFYHGPHRSMVTIGLFTDDDFVKRGNVSVYGPRILEVQQKYPYNLVNGLTMIEKQDGKVVGEQPSFLVRVH